MKKHNHHVYHQVDAATERPEVESAGAYSVDQLAKLKEAAGEIDRRRDNRHIKTPPSRRVQTRRMKRMERDRGPRTSFMIHTHQTVNLL
jgi:hypothetical protein